MEEEIKAGDIVHLKHDSSTLMSVENIKTYDNGNYACCIWFVNSILHREEINVAGLKLRIKGN